MGKTDADYRTDSDEVLYEIEMLYRLREYMAQEYVDRALGNREDQGLPARNAIVEAFAVHVRNLRAFFHGDQGSGNRDVVVGDYLTDSHPDFEKASDPWPGLLSKDLADRVSKQVAHLSGERTASLAENPQWQYEGICHAFRPLIEGMVADINPSRVNDSFVGLARAAVESAPYPDLPTMTTATAETSSGSPPLSAPSPDVVDGSGGGTARIRSTDQP